MSENLWEKREGGKVFEGDKTKYLTYSKASASSTGIVCLKLWKPIQVQQKLLTGALRVPFLQHTALLNHTLQHLKEKQKLLSYGCISLQYRIKPRSLLRLISAIPETSGQLYWIMQASPYAITIKIITMQVDFMVKLERCMDLENSISSY